MPAIAGFFFSLDSDVSRFAYTHVAHEGGFDLAACPAIRAWIERIAQRPRFQPMDAR